MSEHTNTPGEALYAQMQPLSDGNIRLICIEPWHEGDSYLRCTMSTHDLRCVNGKPEFVALSYTWGYPYYNIQELRKIQTLGSAQILCNDQMMIVGENLYDFISHCARQEDSRLHGHIWIDALSINQTDLMERSRQVNMMGETYKAAAEIIVWLGIEDPTTEAAFGLIRDVHALTDEKKAQLHPRAVSENHPDPLLQAKRWTALANFWCREWFGRSWIIQEVVFATQATVFCGKHHVPWIEVATMSGFLATSSWTILLKQGDLFGSNQTSVKSWHNTPARIAAARKTFLSQSQDKLLFALIRARGFHSHDPRDKVYSQLGLGEANILPDYECSIADTYITTAKYIIEHSDNLLILTCSEGQDCHQTPDVPSWVPDWSVNMFSGLGVTGYPQFNAASTRPKKHKFYVLDGKHILTVQAVKVDDIVEVGDNKSDFRKNIHRSNFWDIVSRLDPTYTTGQDREETVWRTMITNRASEPRDISKEYPVPTPRIEPSFRQWILWRYAVTTEELEVFPQSHNQCFPSEAKIRATRKRCSEDPTYLASLAHNASAYDTNYGHAMLLRPFRTGKGYIGIGTKSLQTGDSVWIVSGCRVPLILRKVENTERYQLVGGTYVHGIMNGEFLADENIQFRSVDLE